MDSNQTIYWLLMQIMMQTKHRINQIAEQHGLTMMQSNTLTMLQPDEPLAMNVMSTRFMCDASNVTGIVDRLEKQGLIKRQDHPTDRRIKMIILTSTGRKLKDKLMAEVVATETERLEPVISAQERQDLRRVLEKILAA